MSNAQTGLLGAEYQGDVTIRDAGLVGMIALRGDLGDAGFRAAVQQVSGHAVPDIRKITGDARSGLAWMSPDELMLFCDYTGAEALATDLRAALAGQHHAVTVLSDARAVIRLEGAALREVLAKGAPVDLSPESFAVGDLRRTRLAQVAVAFWLTEPDKAELICFRSVGGFVFEWLKTAAAPGGKVGFFQ